jgi:hypothetical protein
MAPIKPADLRRSLKTTRAHGAPGPSGLPAALWKHEPDWLTPATLRLLNLFLEEQGLPAELKAGQIYPVPKDTSRACTFDNARLLTMLEVLLKLFTKILVQRHGDLLTKHPILEAQQFAFIPGRRIDTAIHLVTTAIAAASRPEAPPLHIMMLDLKSAYDKTQFYALQRSWEAIGAPERLRKIFDDIDRGSTRRVVTTDGITDA